VKEIRESGTAIPKLRINYTANPENLEELDDFFEVFGLYPIDVLQVRPVMDIGGKYRQQFTDADSPRYRAVISRLEGACRQNNVTLLANKEDATYQEENRDADLAELVYTYISPRWARSVTSTWNEFNFRKFRKTDQWNSRLFRAFWKKGKGEGWLGRSLKYDVR